MLWILGPHTGPLLFDAVASLDTSPLAAARYHGDQDVAPGVLDFAVNVRHDRPPEWLVRQLAALLPELARYPSTDDVHRRKTRSLNVMAEPVTKCSRSSGRRRDSHCCTT